MSKSSACFAKGPLGCKERQAHCAVDIVLFPLPQAIPNAWLAGAKGHPFWMFCVQQVIKRAGACAATNTDRQVPCRRRVQLQLACSSQLCRATAMAGAWCLIVRTLRVAWFDIAVIKNNRACLLNRKEGVTYATACKQVGLAGGHDGACDAVGRGGGVQTCQQWQH